MHTTFLHIGLHKTGTTAIQNMLFANRRRLTIQGYLYPETGMAERGHHKLAWALLRDPELMPLWPQLKEEVTRKGAEKLVLSSEEFEFLRTPGRWSRLRELIPESTRVICYLRRQDDFLLSAYNQHVKKGGYEAFDSFSQKLAGRLDYLSRLSVIEDTFGRENMVVRVYEDEQLPKGLLLDFLEIIGVDAKRFNFPPGKANPRLSLPALRIMLGLNPLIPDRELRKQVQAIIQTNLAGSEGLSIQPLMDDSARIALMDQYRESNSEVARRYLKRSDGRLFLTSPTFTADRLSAAAQAS